MAIKAIKHDKEYKRLRAERLAKHEQSKRTKKRTTKTPKEDNDSVSEESGE